MNPSAIAADYAVYIGRFQPFHDGHQACLSKALELAEKVIVVIGSANRPRDLRDPWSFEERRNMIRATLDEDTLARVQFVAVSDYLYTPARWVEAVQSAVDSVIGADRWSIEETPEPYKVLLVGHRRDHTSDYLDEFPQWENVWLEQMNGNATATGIREAYFRHRDGAEHQRALEALPMPEAVKRYLFAFATVEGPDAFATLCGELTYIENCREPYKALKHPVIHQTVDAVVVKSGHILLIKRKTFPGKGLWALPGGFLGEYEYKRDAALRELKEETKIKESMNLLRGSVKVQKGYEYPMRSLRGRTLTEAFLIVLPAGPLSRIKGASDAAAARWVPLAEFHRMEGQLFEDHYHIAQDLLQRIPSE